MMRFSMAILWVLIIAAVALVALAPASWLDRRIASATAGKIRINDAQGTVWRGNGAFVDAQGTWRVPIGWRVEPLAVAKGALDVELEPSEPDAPRGRVLLQNESADLRNVRLTVQARVLPSLSPVTLPIEPGGELVLDAPAFRYRMNQMEGSFDVRWERARVATAGSALDLGTVTAHVAPKGSALVGTIGNVGGDARVDGDVALASSGASVRVNISPGPGVPPDIARLLSALGTPDANGVVHLQWSQRN